MKNETVESYRLWCDTHNKPFSVGELEEKFDSDGYDTFLDFAEALISSKLGDGLQEIYAYVDFQAYADSIEAQYIVLTDSDERVLPLPRQIDQ